MLNVAVIRQSWHTWWSFSVRPAGPSWLQFVWTVLFNTAIAVGLTLVATRSRMRFFAGIPIVGCLIGYWIGLSLLGVDVGRIVQGAPRVVIAIVTVSIIFSTFWYRQM